MINCRVPYSASKFAIRGMMESLYVELRQNYPGNSLHLMLVSPFIVETGELSCDLFFNRQINFHFSTNCDKIYAKCYYEIVY